MNGTGMAAMDVKNFHDCDVAFHRKIWELAGNEYCGIHSKQSLSVCLSFLWLIGGRAIRRQSVSGSPQCSSISPFWKVSEAATSILRVKRSSNKQFNIGTCSMGLALKRTK